MINLSEKHYIDKGGFQKCYAHPDNEKLCIKVKINDANKDPRVDREIKYYKKIQKKGVNYSFWAQYHGTVETSLGTGYIYDLIRDETTNKISKTVAEYLKMECCPIALETFDLEFHHLKNQMIKNKIVIRDVSATNVCCKIHKNNSIELIVIDGVGHRDFIPLVDYIQLFTKRKVNKVYQKKGLDSMIEHKKWLDLLS